MPVQIKFYTVEEANAYLSEAASAMRALKLYRRQAFKLRSRLSVLELIHGDDVRDRADDDGADYRAATRALEFLRPGRQRALKRLRRLGVRITSLAQGRVDFYALRGHEIILLCWQMDEPAVAHWHWPDQSCRARQPIALLEQEDGDSF